MLVVGTPRMTSIVITEDIKGLLTKTCPLQKASSLTCFFRPLRRWRGFDLRCVSRRRGADGMHADELNQIKSFRFLLAKGLSGSLPGLKESQHFSDLCVLWYSFSTLHR